MSADHACIRRFLRALDVVIEAGRLDEYHAEVRRTQPECGIYDASIGRRLFAADLARIVPREFGSPDEIEAAAMQHMIGSPGRTALAAIERIAEEIADDQRRAKMQPAEEAEADPPGPPDDWMPSEAPEPIEATADDYVPPWERRKAGGK